ncbi:MAG: hypothetical protein O2822_04680 [Chloroflexi bacterium]|nr:hypothetical protein [Chloroflexota bacterium]
MTNPDLEREGADWIAEMVSDQVGAFVPSEFCDLVVATEREVRAETGDAEMDHATMAQRLMAIFEADPSVPTDVGTISTALVFEVLHWEDEFRAMAGAPRTVRPSPRDWPAR